MLARENSNNTAVNTVLRWAIDQLSRSLSPAESTVERRTARTSRVKRDVRVAGGVLRASRSGARAEAPAPGVSHC